VVYLYESHVSKINGTKGHDTTNCTLQSYIHKLKGSVHIAKDTRTFLLIEEDIPSGTFLCAEHNDRISQGDYFDVPADISLKAQADESNTVVSVIKYILRNDSSCLPPYMVRYLCEAIGIIECL